MITGSTYCQTKLNTLYTCYSHIKILNDISECKTGFRRFHGNAAIIEIGDDLTKLQSNED